MTAIEQHPRHRLDELLQNPVRFSIVAALDRAATLSFKEVRDAVEITDSALSKQVALVEISDTCRSESRSPERCPAPRSRSPSRAAPRGRPTSRLCARSRDCRSHISRVSE